MAECIVTVEASLQSSIVESPSPRKCRSAARAFLETLYDDRPGKLT
jgi:hypothetical protein